MDTTKLKKVCMERGISGLQLSYSARVAQPDICRYMSGERRPYPAHAQRIADALGWQGDPAELFAKTGV